jgi:hypothetical protein
LDIKEIIMSGGGGAQTTGSQNATSSTMFPQFQNNFLSNAYGQQTNAQNGGSAATAPTGPGIFDLLGSQMSYLQGEAPILQGGGQAAPGSVFAGGASQIPNVPSQYPIGGQFPSGGVVPPPATPASNQGAGLSNT